MLLCWAIIENIFFLMEPIMKVSSHIEEEINCINLDISFLHSLSYSLKRH